MSGHGTDQNGNPVSGWLIIAGNPIDGFTHYGPFDTLGEASDAANSDAHLDGDWWVAPIYPMD